MIKEIFIIINLPSPGILNINQLSYNNLPMRSPESLFIIGINLLVDGGLSAK
jgi:hypothetical protein